MLGQMMQQPLLIASLLRHAERHHGAQEVVSRRVEGDIHRCTYAELAARSRRLARALALIDVANAADPAQALKQIEQAAATQEIHVDAYPYSACSTVLRADAIDESIRIIITWSTPCPEVAGRDLADIAAEWQISQHEACERLSPAGAVYFDMSEDDVQRILAHPLVMIGSDGIPHDSHPHPRLWGTFPRVLGHYSRDVGLFSLEEAVRKMTSLPAQRFGLTQRGTLASGYFADLVVFDPATIRDAATFEQPIAPAVGVALLLVNGQVAYSTRSGLASQRNGRFLTRSGMNSPPEH